MNPRRPSQLAALVAVIALGMVLVAAVTVPAYHWAKKWRAAKLVAGAVVALEGDNLEAAREAATAALQLNPHLLDARRVMAKSVADDSGMELLVLHERVLAASGEHPDPQDLRDYIRVCLVLDFLASSEKALNRLVTRHADDSQNWVLAGDYLLAQGKHESALVAANKALMLDPESSGAILLGCRIALWSDEPAVRQAAESNLLELSERQNRMSLEALVALAMAPILTEPTAVATAAGLRAHPNSNSDARLLAALLDFRRASISEQEPIVEPIVEAIVEATIAEFSSESNMMSLLGWLSLVERHDEIIRLIPAEQALKNRGYFGALATALQLTGKDTEMLKLFAENEGVVPMNRFYSHLMQMDSYKRLDEAEAARRHWNQALRTARIQNPEVTLVLLAQWCDRRSHFDEAIEAYEVLVEQNRDLVEHWYDALVRLYRRTGNTERLLNLSRELATAYPQNPVYLHNAAYLSIVADDGLLEAIESLGAITKAHPRIVGSRCAIALGYHMMGNHAAARDAVSRIDRDRLTGLDKLIMDTVNGSPMASGTSRENLLPEERVIFGMQ